MMRRRKENNGYMTTISNTMSYSQPMSLLEGLGMHVHELKKISAILTVRRCEIELEFVCIENDQYDV